MKFDVKNERNLTMLTDLYQLTMMNVYSKSEPKIGCFDLFYRKNPDNAGFTVFAGLEKVIDYMKSLKFEEDDIEYLRALKRFDEPFMEYLRDFKFECDVWAMPEGTVAFPGEPLVVVKGPLEQAQFVESTTLEIINHQARIATKAERIVRAAAGKEVMEFGLRRAHGATAALDGARASYIGGMVGTSDVLAGKEYGIPVGGTMAHSYIQQDDCEYEAFKKYAETYPDSSSFLVDTYNTLKSGVPNAIRVGKEILEPMGEKLKSIRLDSGDLASLAKESRKMLDDAGLDYVKIFASNSLDEFTISELVRRDAPIDTFGVGERNITATSNPILGGVYKLAQIEYADGRVVPKMKFSEDKGKMTNPGEKKVTRLYDKETNKAVQDILGLRDEDIIREEYIAKELMVPIFIKGELAYEVPTLEEVRNFCMSQVETLTEEVKKFDAPEIYPVVLSEKLDEMKNQLIEQNQF